MAKVGSPEQYLLKIIIVGDSAVGKTKLLGRFSDESFSMNYVSTIGVDFKVKSIMLDDKKIKFQVWDTAGQERYRTIAQTYYKGASGVILVYSITDSDSFRHIQNWAAQIKDNAQPDIKMFLVGNKMDNEVERKISTQQGKKMADKYGIPFSQTSAKEGTNVHKVFEDLGKAIITELDKLPKEQTMGGKFQSHKLRVPSAGQNSYCSC